MLLHIYCTKVFVVKLYYSKYISLLRSGDSNQISEKAIKGLITNKKQTILGIIQRFI